MSHPKPIPHLKGVEHVGMTVPDLDVATRFLQSVIGASILYDIGPFTSPDDWMATHLAGHGRNRIHRIRALEVATGPVLELIELISPGGDRVTGDRFQQGWHIAFYVDDMELALGAVKAHGCPIQSGPVTMTEGPSAGLQWLYFQSPWGQQLELVSYPDGLEAYKARSVQVWRPK